MAFSDILGANIQEPEEKMEDLVQVFMILVWMGVGHIPFALILLVRIQTLTNAQVDSKFFALYLRSSIAF